MISSSCHSKKVYREHDRIKLKSLSVRVERSEVSRTNKTMNTYYVYILLCSDGTYYTGVTSNLANRIQQHQVGYYPNSYTFKRRPIQQKYYCEFTNVWKAIDFEKQLKKWSKVKKIAFINGKSDLLPELAKKTFG